MKIEDEFHLDLSLPERQSELWRKIKSFLENELKNARARNDDPALTEPQTAALRGRIQSLKALINLGERPLPTE